jgi:4-amino-4-deoxy-L-arabinose transferase-like glycosyltransferase
LIGRLRSAAPLMALAVVLLAAGLRLHLLGAQSLWNDEGSSYVQATRTFSAIADNAARDIHPPGYYWMLAAWRALTGESEFALRALSAFASVVTVALVYAIGRRLMNPWAGVFAAALVALNTFAIYYAQEARMYALLALWAAGAVRALTGLLDARTPRARWTWAAALALLNAAGLWTQYVYPAFMLAQGAALLVWWLAGDPRRAGLRAPLTAYVSANLVTIALFLPWLPAAWAQITAWPNTGDAVPPLEALAAVMSALTVGVTSAYSGAGVPVLMILVFGLMTRPGDDPRRTLWRALWRLAVPVLWVVIPVALFVGAGLYREANLKFLLPAQAGFALWLTRGLWLLWHLVTRRREPLFRAAPRGAALAAGALLLVALAGAVPALYSAPEFQRDDYRGIVAAIAADPQPDIAVILNAPGQQEAFEYYARSRFDVVPLPVGMTPDADATRAAVAALIAGNSRIYAVLWGTDERDPDGIVEDALNRGAFQIDDRWYGSVRLVRYVTPLTDGTPQTSGARFGDIITLESFTLSGASVTTGDALQVRLTWDTDAPVSARYKVFVQLLNPDGTLAAQRDSEPGGGRLPTVTWTPGEPVSDNHALLIPEALPPGDYRLILGLYDADDPLARLPVSTGGDALDLATIRVHTR